MKTGCFSSDDDVFQFGPWLRSLAPKASRKKDSGNSQLDARDEDEDDIQSVAEDFDDSLHHRQIQAELPMAAVMINPRQSVSFGTLPGRDTTILALEKKLVPISKGVSNFQMDKVVKITEIASNSNSKDVILVQNHDKPNCFLPYDTMASHLDTNLNCDDKTIIPRELEHCDNAEIHIIDFFESSSNIKSTHHSCPVSEIEVSNFKNSIGKLPEIFEDIEMEFS